MCSPLARSPSQVDNTQQVSPMVPVGERQAQASLSQAKAHYNIEQTPLKKSIEEMKPQLESAFSELRALYADKGELSSSQKALLSELFALSGYITYGESKKECALLYGYSAWLDAADSLHLAVDLKPIFETGTLASFQKEGSALVDGDDDPLKPFLQAVGEKRSLLIEKTAEMPELGFQIALKLHWMGYSYQNFDSYLGVHKKAFLPLFETFYETSKSIYQQVKESGAHHLQSQANWWQTKVHYDTDFYCFSLKNESELIPEDVIESWKEKMQALCQEEGASSRSYTMQGQIFNRCAVSYQNLSQKGDLAKSEGFKQLAEKNLQESLSVFDRHQTEVDPALRALANKNYVQSSLKAIIENPNCDYDKAYLEERIQIAKKFLEEGTPAYLFSFYATFALFEKVINKDDNQAQEWLQKAKAEAYQKDSPAFFQKYMDDFIAKYFA
ncbi:MAG: hypothetical protein K0S07_1318 [Chlamydiales bacterium]|nr:hypothetical protein [Chlamydiales bacterium]